MGLFTPAWQSKDPKKRIQGITKLNDQDALRNIAATDQYLEVRLAAVERITDELFLTQLCLALKRNDVSAACIKKITMKQLLLELALKDQTGIAENCVIKLKPSLSKDELHAILFDAADSRARKQAASFTEDYADLLELALKDQTGIAKDCVDKLKPSLSKADLRLIIFRAADPAAQDRAAYFAEDYSDLLEYILLKHPSESIRKIAIFRIRQHKTPGIFWDAVIKYAEGETMSYTIENLLEEVISDMKQEDILRIASDSRTISVARKLAIKILSDKAPLLSLAFSEKDTEIQALMISYITDNDALLKIYNDSQDEKVKQAVIQAMSDEKLLTEIAYRDKDKYACLKLGGYLCSFCYRENLPEAGQPVSCACKHCQAENHHLERKHKTEEHNRSSETSSSWDECTRCGAISNYKSDFRYTDW